MPEHFEDADSPRTGDIEELGEVGYLLGLSVRAAFLICVSSYVWIHWFGIGLLVWSPAGWAGGH